MFCFNEFAFTVQVKQKNSIQINSWLYFDMSVFYDWPFPHMYFAKNVAYFPFNSWHSFQRLCHLLWGCHLGEKLLSRHKTHKCTHTQLTNCSMWPLERSVKNMLLSKSQMAQSTKQNNADLKTLCADITGWVPDSVSGIRFQSNVRPLRLLKTSSTIVHNKRAE